VTLPSVLVLAGGPDAERDISLASGRAVAQALRDAGHPVDAREITTVDAEGLASMPGEVVFPVLHGVWGEGGPLQSMLVNGDRPFVGSGPLAARLAMDKIATKLVAGGLGVPTPEAFIVHPADAVSSLPLPLVVKPVHEGSSVGLSICTDEAEWAAAHARVVADRTPSRLYMAERMIRGRELTAGLVGDGASGFLDLPLVEIVSSSGVYDFEAKYTRGDTRYIVEPELPSGVEHAVRDAASKIARAIGVRHLGRVDFLLDTDSRFWLLEVNTLPGFTASSLLPKAAAARGLDLPRLASHLVTIAQSESTPVGSDNE